MHKEQCKHGHVLSPENLYIRKTGQRSCQTCRKTDSKRRYLRNPDYYKFTHKTHCVNGHEFTPENTYITPSTGFRGCKTCVDLRSLKRKANKSIQYKRYDLKKNYGLLLEDYQKQCSIQNNCCAICDKKVSVLSVDHDHKTGKIRKLLCDGCNKGLGCFYENPEALIKAAAYILEHRKS